MGSFSLRDSGERDFRCTLLKVLAEKCLQGPRRESVASPTLAERDQGRLLPPGLL